MSFDINKIKDRVFGMVDVGFTEDGISRAYDIVNLFIILLNLTVSVALTFSSIRATYADVLTAIESFTIAFFALDYILRLWTADHIYPELSKPVATLRYAVSLAGIVDLVSFLPYYLPAFYPAGTAAFRLFRVMRIFKLFRIGAYSDSLSIIGRVIYNKRQQLYSSMFIILVLMVASSLCMYNAEHEAQPEVFKNAFSGLWWAGSTLLTVGYGDIYPITDAGKLMGTCIAFLGVGVVAIPTGIISAGFIECYSELKEQETELGSVDFCIRITAGDAWTGAAIEEIAIPGSMKISGVIRENERMEPKHDMILKAGDVVRIKTELVK